MNAPQMNPGRSQLPTYITRIVLLGPYYSTLRILTTLQRFSRGADRMLSRCRQSMCGRL